MTLLVLVTYAVVNELLAQPARARRFGKIVLAIAAVASLEMLLPTSTAVIALVLLLDLLLVVAGVSLLVQKALNRTWPPIRTTPRRTATTAWRANGGPCLAISTTTSA